MMKLKLTVLAVLISLYGFSQTIYPEDFGAVGNGIADDLPALDSAVKYLGKNGGVIDLRNHVYRITDTWVLGNKFKDEADAYYNGLTTSPTFNLQQYLNTLSKKPIKIIGGNKAGIYGDFDTTFKKAIIYYALYGDLRASPGDEKYAAEISGIAVYGKGSFSNGVPVLRPSAAGYNYTNNQIGILCLNNFKMIINNCTMYGLNTGMLLNNSYFSNITNMLYNLCGTGLYHVQSHGSTMSNLVSYYCLKGYEIRSAQITMTNINSEHSKIGLHIIGGMNVVNGCYLESNKNSGLSQLLIGLDSTDFDYNAGIRASGIIISGLTIAASNPDGSIGNNVMLKSTADAVIIKGANLNSGIWQRNGNGYIIAEGISGTLPSWAYDRTKNISADNVTSYGNVTTTKTFKGDSLSVNKIVNAGVASTGSLVVGGDIKKNTAYVATSGGMRSKNISGFYSADYIMRLGKYSVADGTKISGRLMILGNSVYTGPGWIDIMYSNLVTGYVYAAFSAMTATQNIAITFVKYTDGADTWAGIRFKTTATNAWLPYSFNFDGYLSDGNNTLSSIDAATVTNIVPLTSPNTKFELKSQVFNITQ